MRAISWSPARIFSTVRPACRASCRRRRRPARSSRNTLLFRRGEHGASLRLVGATAPRNLRAVGAKILICDESDALQTTVEGDAIALAERRTLAYPDRKLIVGSTPLSADTSHVCKLYGQSDQRIYECRCPHCHGYAEVVWEAIEWPPGHPDQAVWVCPLCDEPIAEEHKDADGAGRPLARAAAGSHEASRL